MTISISNWNEGIDPNQQTSLVIAVVASMLELDMVELVQHYLALYSVYAAHMGQCKEAAQVAIKHMIFDFRKEVVAWDTMPPLLLVALTVAVTIVDHNAASLQSLVICLSGAARKSLLA